MHMDVTLMQFRGKTFQLDESTIVNHETRKIAYKPSSEEILSLTLPTIGSCVSTSPSAARRWAAGCCAAT